MIDKLRKKYPVFVYDGFTKRIRDNNLEISFDFRVDPDITFSPFLRIKNLPPNFSDLDDAIIDNFIFHLGLVEIPSYWKAICSPVIKINAGGLDDEQIKWWMDLMINGMGQFYYENKINFLQKDFLKIESKKKGGVKNIAGAGGENVLVPVGGGKDSAVSLEIFLKNKRNIGAFVVNPTAASLKTIRAAKVKETITVERTIDPTLIDLNKKGYLNGHTPLSAVFAFISVFCSYIYGYKDVALSNERSSDEGNMIYLGKKINHQYSKTFDFENKFRKYNLKYLSDINYFSFLRPLYELQISEIFSKYPKYFSLIRSCNVGQKMGGVWCGECSKCLSTFILLYPFLKKRTAGIFSKNLYDDASLFPLLKDLILETHIKPFECVGTKEELKVGLYLSMKGEKNLPYLLRRVWNEYLSKEEDWEERSKNVLGAWGDDNNLTKEFNTMLKVEL